MELQRTKVDRCPYCKVRSARARHLDFISLVSRDGSGTVKVEGHEHPDGEMIFTLLPLSLTEETFIASGFNSYVVRIKKTP